jgi:uncharacterized OB-fold protein
MLTSYDKPLPVIDADSKGYWDYARSHRLSVQVCKACGHRHFPPTPVCPNCLSDAQTWEPVSGRGTLVSWVTFHRAYWPAFRDDLPYHVCLVQLDDGPLIVSNFAGNIPHNAEMGMPMKVQFDDVTPDISLAKFVPA